MSTTDGGDDARRRPGRSPTTGDGAKAAKTAADGPRIDAPLPEASVAGRLPDSVDPTPARGLWAYVRIMSGRHQILAAFLACLASALHIVPVELQRRLIDDAVAGGDRALLLTLGALYAGVVLAHQGVKYILGMQQERIGQRTVAYTRQHLYGIRAARLTEAGGGPDEAEARGDGEAVSILNAETERLGRFVGAGPSGALASGTILLGVVGYMLYVEPVVAAASLVMLAPQALATPLMQRRLNRLTQRRLRLLRRFGEDVAAEDAPPARRVSRRIGLIMARRLAFVRWKMVMKALLNAMQSGALLAVFLVGGLMAINGQTTVGVIVAFTAGFSRISDPIRELIAFYRDAAQARVHHEMIAAWMTRGKDG